MSGNVVGGLGSVGEDGLLCSKWAAFAGLCGEALCDQRSSGFRLPVFEGGLLSIGCVNVGVGRKCISSMITANWQFSLVTPKTRPVTNI